MNCQEFIIKKHLCTWRARCKTLDFFIPKVEAMFLPRGGADLALAHLEIGSV